MPLRSLVPKTSCRGRSRDGKVTSSPLNENRHQMLILHRCMYIQQIVQNLDDDVTNTSALQARRGGNITSSVISFVAVRCLLQTS